VIGWLVSKLLLFETLVGFNFFVCVCVCVFFFLLLNIVVLTKKAVVFGTENGYFSSF
jgi:hypothetical protein